MEPTVFVTGATGFIGSAVLHHLATSGFVATALVRRDSRRDHLPAFGVRLVEGDIRDRLAVAKAMAGARYVFHVAADYRLSTRRQSDMASTNVTGTRIVMEEALRAGVERVVYTSSVATLALRPGGEPSDETLLASEAELVGTCKRTKLAAERLVLDMIAQQGLPAIIVNPAAPIGPRDVRPTPTGRLILEASAGRIPAFVDTGLNLVHVEDVAQGHLAALLRGGSASAIFSAARTCCCRICLRILRGSWAAPAPAFACPGIPCFRSPAPPRPSRMSRAANP